MSPAPVHLYGLLPADLVAHMEARGERCSLTEARQVLSRVISEGSSDPTPRREPRRALVEAVRRQTTWARLEVLERIPDDEGKSVRYLFRSPDGALSEAVRIGLHKADHYTVCLSSQVGCAMQCAFCATGRLGLTRNLEPWEIISAFLTVREEAEGRVSGAVFMGQGWLGRVPLHTARPRGARCGRAYGRRSNLRRAERARPGSRDASRHPLRGSSPSAP